jgi:hypothetical protein
LHPAVVDVDTGSLEGDLVAFIRSVADSMSVRREDLSQDIALALNRHPEFRAAINEKFVLPRVAVLGQVIARARERGELGQGETALRLTPEAASSFVIGPLHHRVYVLGRQPTPAFQKGVVVASLASLRALSPVD